MTDAVEYVTKAKWKWVGHIDQMKGNRWNIRSTEWQVGKGVMSVGKAKRNLRGDIVG